MEFKLKKNNNATVELKLTFDSKDLEEAFDRTYKEKQKDVRLPGFRPGKAPLELVKKHLGDSVASDAVTNLLSHGVNEIIGKLEYPMIAFPQFDIQEYNPGKQLIAVATYDTTPEITLGKYKKVKVKVPELNITEEDISEELKGIQKKLARKQLKEEGEKVTESDLLEMEYSVREEGKEDFTPPSQVEYRMGQEGNLPGFDTHLVGLGSEEEKSFQYKFPEDHEQEEVRGKTLEYKVKIKGIYKETLPDIDDDLASEFDQSENLEALKDKIRKSVSEQAEDLIKQKKLDEIYHEIIEDSKFVFPETYIREESNAIFHNMLHEVRLPHMEFSEYAKMTGQTEEAAREQFKKAAEERLKIFFTRRKISELEGIQITEEDLDEEIKKLAEAQGMEFDSLKKDLEEKNLLENYRQNLLSRKVDAWVYDTVEKKSSGKLKLGDLKDYLEKKEEKK